MARAASLKRQCSAHSVRPIEHRAESKPSSDFCVIFVEAATVINDAKFQRIVMVREGEFDP